MNMKYQTQEAKQAQETATFNGQNVRKLEDKHINNSGLPYGQDLAVKEASMKNGQYAMVKKITSDKYGKILGPVMATLDSMKVYDSTQIVVKDVAAVTKDCGELETIVKTLKEAKKDIRTEISTANTNLFEAGYLLSFYEKTETELTAKKSEQQETLKTGQKDGTLTLETIASSTAKIGKFDEDIYTLKEKTSITDRVINENDAALITYEGLQRDVDVELMKVGNYLNQARLSLKASQIQVKYHFPMVRIISNLGKLYGHKKQLGERTKIYTDHQKQQMKTFTELTDDKADDVKTTDNLDDADLLKDQAHESAKAILKKRFNTQ